MKIILCSLLLIVSSAGFSQSTTTFYFDNNMKVAGKENAAFKATGEPDDSLYKLTCYNIFNNSLVFMAHFADSAFNVFQGLFRSYFPNGSIESEGVYNNGKEQGLWKRKDGEGNLSDSTWYVDGKKERSVSYTYYPDKHVESMVMNDSKNDTYRVTFYNENGKAIEDSTGIDDSDVVLTKVEIEAAFPGGPAAWARYISRQIQNNTDEFTDKDYGTCFVKFIVDTNGHISSVHAITMAGTRLAKVAVNAIVSGPAWLPAQANGKYVKAFKIQPVTLTDPDR